MMLRTIQEVLYPAYIKLPGKKKQPVQVAFSTGKIYAFLLFASFNFNISNVIHSKLNICIIEILQYIIDNC